MSAVRLRMFPGLENTLQVAILYRMATNFILEAVHVKLSLFAHPNVPPDILTGLRS